ncbi:HlyD family secretion protein [Arcicella aurantiaca]|uniref:HlyD family secretion protein n=1 Tax=Arcicella aurantiaca TaxID=591202 RepID=A0A316DK64_9BACT|nr:HlyD family efflux transporter periplasmic adaptor subunit [Arcicella aurantiaca]PWK18066.1 HlyD family secretion protein [Arcicella aurantiaca]
MPESVLHIPERSDEMQEIIGYVPHWVIRWGVSIIFIALAIILMTSVMIQYPDTLTAKALINAREQPQKITWYTTDPEISYESKVKDAQNVIVGDTLVIENDQKTNIITPITAKVSGRTYLLKGVENKPKAWMLLVVPKVSNYEVQLRLPVHGAGKVKKGQRVLVKLDAYPQDEFGFLEGEITEMVPVSIDNYYRANVKLTNGLITNVGKTLPIQPLLQGSAEVMLDDKRISSRIFGTLF